MELFGVEWLEDAYKHIQEDRREHYEWMMSLMPLGRTPMSEEGARALKNYARDIQRSLKSLTPWDVEDSYRKALKEKVGSGNVKVFLDAGEHGLVDHPSFKDAEVVKE